MSTPCGTGLNGCTQGVNGNHGSTCYGGGCQTDCNNGCAAGFCNTPNCSTPCGSGLNGCANGVNGNHGNVCHKGGCGCGYGGVNSVNCGYGVSGSATAYCGLNNCVSAGWNTQCRRVFRPRCPTPCGGNSCNPNDYGLICNGSGLNCNQPFGVNGGGCCGMQAECGLPQGNGCSNGFANGNAGSMGFVNGGAINGVTSF